MHLSLGCNPTRLIWNILVAIATSCRAEGERLCEEPGVCIHREGCMALDKIISAFDLTYRSFLFIVNKWIDKKYTCIIGPTWNPQKLNLYQAVLFEFDKITLNCKANLSQVWDGNLHSSQLVTAKQTCMPYRIFVHYQSPWASTPWGSTEAAIFIIAILG